MKTRKILDFQFQFLKTEVEQQINYIFTLYIQYFTDTKRQLRLIINVSSGLGNINRFLCLL